MSSSFNMVVLIGSVDRNVELRHTPAGVPVCNATIVVTKTWTKKGKVQSEKTPVDVTLWGGKAEHFVESFAKGDEVVVEGYVKLDQWTHKGSGQKRSKLIVVGERVQLAD